MMLEVISLLGKQFRNLKTFRDMFAFNKNGLSVAHTEAILEILEREN